MNVLRVPHVVIAAILEINEDALCEYKPFTLMYFFLLIIHRFKLRKCSKTKIILFPSGPND